MKRIILLVVLATAFSGASALADGARVFSRDAKSGRWVSYGTNTRAPLYVLNAGWSAEVCYAGDIRAAASVIRRMAANEGVPASTEDEDGRVFQDTFILRANARSGVITLKARTHDEHGGYRIDRLIPRC